MPVVDITSVARSLGPRDESLSKTSRILVVDDEPDLEPLLLQRMRREIRKGTYSFTFASNGIEALDKLREDEGIQVVLSDINMPRMDGLTLLQHIPSVNPNVRSVIISAYGDMKNIRMAMNRGAFDFVTKPIDFDDLKLTIKRTVEHLELWHEALSARDKLISLNNELSIANQMQQSILPVKFPTGNNFRISGFMEPARNVGGDFFDVYKLPSGKVGMAIADVSDKGVPAALFMMSSRTLMKGAAIGAHEPAVVLEEVNRLLLEDNTANMFVTVLYAVIDTDSGKVTYANGGHNPPMLVKDDGSASLLPMPGGIALGMFDSVPFNSSQYQLETGDTLFLYTDGITEAVNRQGEFFEEERMLDVASKAIIAGSPDPVNDIVQAVHTFSEGLDQTDDITCIAISFGKLDMVTNFTIICESFDFTEVNGKIMEIGMTSEWSQKLLIEVQLAVEELMLNVFSHGSNGEGTCARLDITGSGKDVVITISDNGVPFNPVADSPEPDIDAGLEDRKIGGLGVHLVKTLADELSYRREDGHNILTIRMSDS